MRRYPTGTVDQYIYFVAVDASDFVTRETGLASFTVVRSRNGAADATYTTPTVSEIDATTMPGVYALLLDEDMTIAAGNDSEEVCLHITHTGMAPATVVYELYRREVTGGETLTVSSGIGQASVQSVAAAALADFFDTDSGTTYASAVAGSVVKEIADNAGGSALTVDAIADAVWDEAQSGHTTAGTFGEIATETAAILVDTAEIGAAGAGLTEAGGTGDHLTAVPWNASWDAEVQSEVADGLAVYDPPTKAELDAAVAPLALEATLTTVAGYLDTEVAAILADTNELQTDWADGGRLDLILDARASQTSVDTIDTEVGVIDGIVDAILLDTAEIGAAGAGLTEAGGTGDHLTAVPWNASWDAEVESEVTDALNAYDPPTNTEMVAAFTEIKGATWATTDTLEAIRDRGDAAWITATGFSTLDAAGVRAAVGLASADLDTQLAALPTANENADALLDRADGVETGLTPRGAMRLNTAVLAGKMSGGGTGTETFRNAVADTKDRLVSTNDSDGNRTAITTDVT